MRQYDSGDLAIASLLLICLASILTGHYDAAIVTGGISAIAGIGRSGEKRDPNGTPKGS